MQKFIVLLLIAAVSIGAAFFPYQSYVVNVKSGAGGNQAALGNTVSYSDGALSSATSALSSASVNCAASDAGKSIIVHGSGAAGVPQLGTISSCSGNSFVTSFSASTTVTGARFTYGTDDTAAVTALIAYAISNKLTVYFPAGAYWLATQSTAIPLNNVTLYGDGWPGNAWPFSGGTTILIGNKTTSAFSGMSSVGIRDMAFYYPEQDNTQSVPVIFPALFQSGQFVNDVFSRVRFLNPYWLTYVDTTGPGSGWGRVEFDTVLAYCVDQCFRFLNGGADTLQTNGTSYFGAGAYGNDATGGSAMLDTYTNTSGELIHFDISGGAKTTFTGVIMTGGLVHGYRYGTRIVSGSLDVSNFTGVNWDSVGTALSVEGSSSITQSNIVDGSIYSINRFDATAAANAINLDCTSQTVDITITGVQFNYSQGHELYDHGLCSSKWTVTGNKFNTWGRSNTVGTYYAIAVAGNAGLRATISGNGINGLAKAGNGIDGIFVSGAAADTITGNTLDKTRNPITVTGAQGATAIDGNTTIGTTGAASLTNTVSGTATVALGINNFDKGPSLLAVAAPQGRLTLVTGVPVMATTQSAKGTLYYTAAYGAGYVPYYTGWGDVSDPIASNQVSTAMQTSSTGVLNAAGVFDVWWVHSGANRICIATDGSGGGWAADTAGSNTARGTGYSQLDLTTRPYATNANALPHCYNGATDYGSVAVNQATYLGTVATDSGSAGKVSWTLGGSASGGTAAWFGICNYYNQVPVGTMVQDSNGTPWTYGTAAWRAFDGAGTGSGANNRVTSVSCNGQNGISVQHVAIFKAGAAAQAGALGIGIDSTTAQSGSTSINGTTSQLVGTATYSGNPGAGLHYVQALEYGNVTNATTFNGAGTIQVAPAVQALTWNGLL